MRYSKSDYDRVYHNHEASNSLVRILNLGHNASHGLYQNSAKK